MKTYDFDQEQILKRIDKQTASILAKLTVNTLSDINLIILDTQQVLCILNISKRCLQDWRSKGIINYSQINGKFFYTYKDIIELIHNHSKTKPYNGTDI